MFSWGKKSESKDDDRIENEAKKESAEDLTEEENAKAKAPYVPPVRLNPKLTQRRQIRPDAPSYLLAGPKDDDSDDYLYESSEDDEDYDPEQYETPRTEDTEEVEIRKKKEERLKLKHANNSVALSSVEDLKQLGEFSCCFVHVLVLSFFVLLCLYTTHTVTNQPISTQS